MLRSWIVALLVIGLAGLNIYQYRNSGAADTSPLPRVVLDSLDSGAPPDILEHWRDRPYVPHGRPLLDTKWFGIGTLQHPYDVWTTQEIIFEVKPGVIVETSERSLSRGWFNVRFDEIFQVGQKEFSFHPDHLSRVSYGLDVELRAVVLTDGRVRGPRSGMGVVLRD